MRASKKIKSLKTTIKRIKYDCMVKTRCNHAYCAQKIYVPVRNVVLFNINEIIQDSLETVSR